MNIEFPDTMREYTYSRRTFFWRNLRLRLPAILMISAGVFLMLHAAFNYSVREMLLWGVAWIVPFFLLIAYGTYSLLIKNKMYDLPHTFAFDDDYFYVTTLLSEQRYRWDFYNGFKEDRDFVRLVLSYGSVFLPKAIWNQEELEAIRRHLLAKAKSRKVWLRGRNPEATSGDGNGPGA